LDYGGRGVKTFFKQFKTSGSQARTLSPEAIGTHTNGWTITGIIHEDYYYWVNDFSATKGKMWVKGNFEVEVTASSKKAYDEFVKEFPYSEWDYWDI
jgi:hypothetical protein